MTDDARTVARKWSLRVAKFVLYVCAVTIMRAHGLSFWVTGAVFMLLVTGAQLDALAETIRTEKEQ